MPYYSFDPGLERNPLRRYRNLPCPCQSGQKVKRCHGRLDALPKELIPAVKAWLRELSAYGFIEARKWHQC